MYKSIKELMTAAADKFRGYLGTADKIPTQDFPAKIDAVYAAGQAAGGGGGASDPAADAVKALLNISNDTSVGGWNASPPDGVFVCIGGGYQEPTVVVIPSNKTSIEAWSFMDECWYPTQASIMLSLPASPPAVRDISMLIDDYSHSPKAIYVPDESVDAYKAAENWSEFAHLIKPMSLLVNGITFHFEHPHGDIIEFTVAKGTTFGEWIESDEVKNHPSGIYDWMGAYNNHISTPSQDVYRADTKEFVLLSDEIISGMTYLCNANDYYQ